MSPPAISIVTPCYNGARYLRATIDCVLSQTFPVCELLVVDDGSTDDSAQIAESYGPPVRVIRQMNQGESVARNRGIDEARGDYLLFLDADDLLDSEALQRLVTATGGSLDVVALMGCAWFDGDPSRPLKQLVPAATAFFPAIVGGNLGPIHCWLVPTNLVRRVGGFCGQIQQFEDWDLWAQVALQRPPLVTLDYVGAYYRRHPGAQTKVSPKLERSRGHCAVLERLAQGVLERPDLIAEHGTALFWAAWTAWSHGRRNGLSDRELAPLRKSIQRIARNGPPALRRQRFARMVRWCGVSWAERSRSLLARERKVTE